jgi:hypothetical protein
MNLIRHSRRTGLCFTPLGAGAFGAIAQTWSAKLDEAIRVHQPTDVGAIVVGTKRSVYAVNGRNGDVLWRRKNAALDENEVGPVPGTIWSF